MNRPSLHNAVTIAAVLITLCATRTPQEVEFEESKIRKEGSGGLFPDQPDESPILPPWIEAGVLHKLCLEAGG